MASLTSAQNGVSQREIKAMGDLLLEKYGSKAAEVADVFMLEHAKADDMARADAWGEVASYLVRLLPDGVSVH